MIEVQIFQHIKHLMQENDYLRRIPFLTYLPEEPRMPTLLFIPESQGEKCVLGRIEIFSSYKGLQEVLRIQKEIVETLEASHLDQASPVMVKFKALQPMKESRKGIVKSAVAGRVLNFIAKLN
jgi:hypothetical protein